MELKIRKMTMDDLEPLCRLLSDPDVMRYLERPYTREQTKDFLERAGLAEPPLVYSVEAQGRFIGYVIDHAYDASSTEIGWVLFPECWGKGYASELTKQLIGKARQENKNVVIECDPAQKASRRIAQKNGFCYCGKEGGLEVYKLSVLNNSDPDVERKTEGKNGCTEKGQL